MKPCARCLKLIPLTHPTNECDICLIVRDEGGEGGI